MQQPVSKYCSIPSKWLTIRSFKTRNRCSLKSRCFRIKVEQPIDTILFTSGCAAISWVDWSVWISWKLWKVALLHWQNNHVALSNSVETIPCIQSRSNCRGYRSIWPLNFYRIYIVTTVLLQQISLTNHSRKIWIISLQKHSMPLSSFCHIVRICDSNYTKFLPMQSIAHPVICISVHTSKMSSYVPWTVFWLSVITVLVAVLCTFIATESVEMCIGAICKRHISTSV